MKINPPIRILMAKPGLDGHDRGIKVLAAAYRDAGMDVIYLGLRQTPESVVKVAIQEGVDVIALSILSGAHMTIFSKVMELIKENNLNNVLVTGGGIIPEEDAEELSSLGVGYSLNDTIVILDRIRENMKSSGTVMFESTINKSINQSLSRTLITSLTTLFVIVVLLVYGGEVIRPFSFTMLVGVIVGTYSSIYIASALLATIYQSSNK